MVRLSVVREPESLGAIEFPITHEEDVLLHRVADAPLPALGQREPIYAEGAFRLAAVAKSGTISKKVEKSRLARARRAHHNQNFTWPRFAASIKEDLFKPILLCALLHEGGV